MFISYSVSSLLQNLIFTILINSMEYIQKSFLVRGKRVKTFKWIREIYKEIN